MPIPAELSAQLAKAATGAAAQLERLSEHEASAKPGSAWSRKEELGHLIDSAANNHARFVRAALESPYRDPGYHQEAWVGLHGYHELPWTALVSLWKDYNALLAHLVARIPEERLEAECYIGGKGPMTLGFIIDDYARHLRHHLDHILRPAV